MKNINRAKLVEKDFKKYENSIKLTFDGLQV